MARGFGRRWSAAPREAAGRGVDALNEEPVQRRPHARRGAARSVPNRARRVAWLPDGRPRDALGEEPGAPQGVPRRHHRALRRARRRSRGDPRGGRLARETPGSTRRGARRPGTRWSRSRPVSGLEWRRGGRPFAALAGDAAEFRLDPLVASAALRTPDTSASKRGADWVASARADVDEHAVDRAQAWLASAWRRAES